MSTTRCDWLLGSTARWFRSTAYSFGNIESASRRLGYAAWLTERTSGCTVGARRCSYRCTCFETCCGAFVSPCCCSLCGVGGAFCDSTCGRGRRGGFCGGWGGGLEYSLAIIDSGSRELWASYFGSADRFLFRCIDGFRCLVGLAAGGLLDSFGRFAFLRSSLPLIRCVRRTYRVVARLPEYHQQRH